MNRESKVLQRAESAGEYLAPSIKVKEFRSRKVLCASGSVSCSTTEYNEDEDNIF